MVAITVSYEGNLHCRLRHEPSGTEIFTDAPKDNLGKGESFSPTDLAAASLASCILTTMAIYGQRHGLTLSNFQARVEKEMANSPRRIQKLAVTIHMPAGLSPEQRKVLERVANTCPVHQSLKEEVEIPLRFIYPDSSL